MHVAVTTLLNGVPGRPAGPVNASAAGLLAHPQRMRLVRAFAAIGDKGVRASLLALTEGIARRARGRAG